MVVGFTVHCAQRMGAGRSGRASIVRIEQSQSTAVLHKGSEHVPMFAELCLDCIEDRVSDTS